MMNMTGRLTSAEGKLSALREKLVRQGLSGFLLPVHDEWLGEYPAAHGRRLEWLCGFNGSAGLLAVLPDQAALFTDGRYTLQAAMQLDGHLFQCFNTADRPPADWIVQQLKKGASVGYDPQLHTQEGLELLARRLKKHGIALTPLTPNPVDALWHDRSAAPGSAAFAHDARHAGESAASKRARLANRLASQGADCTVLTAPDGVNWLLNIRGSDEEYTPVAHARAILYADGRVRLFIDPAKVTPALRRHLGKDVDVSALADMDEHLRRAGKKGLRVLYDRVHSPAWYAQLLAEAGAEMVEGEDPTLLPKALKNPAELRGIRQAHRRDGLALTRFLCWLDRRGRGRTELDAAEQLFAFRRQSKLFRAPSFATIAGSGSNGAIVHYRATPQSARRIGTGLLLIDSGGQYPGGTTDVTRTVAVGKPTREQRDRFTRVLKGHIALATARFPRGTSGSQLDALARQFLWQAGLDYDHGTGHGVGCFLHVHEGPQRIAKRGGGAPLQPGMVISNEPGYYKAGEYGIRIENLVAVTEAPGKAGGFLALETLTCAPIDRRLVDAAMLTDAERGWLNSYHAWVFKVHAKELSPEERVWLKGACTPI